MNLFIALKMSNFVGSPEVGKDGSISGPSSH